MTETEIMSEPHQQYYAHEAYKLLGEHILNAENMPEDFQERWKLPDVERVIVSYGWAGSTNNRGVCIMGPGMVEGKDALIFIRPEDWCHHRQMLTVLFHEMVHAGLGVEDEDSKEHTGLFDSICSSHGLTNGGRQPNDEFIEMIDEIANDLPEFPAAPYEGWDEGSQVVVVVPGDPAPGQAPAPPSKPQTGRMRKHECDCGVIVRAARDELDATCNLCHTKFKHVPSKPKEETK